MHLCKLYLVFVLAAVKTRRDCVAVSTLAVAWSSPSTAVSASIIHRFVIELATDYFDHSRFVRFAVNETHILIVRRARRHECRFRFFVRRCFDELVTDRALRVAVTRIVFQRLPIFQAKRVEAWRSCLPSK